MPNPNDVVDTATSPVTAASESALGGQPLSLPADAVFLGYELMPKNAERDGQPHLVATSTDQLHAVLTTWRAREAARRQYPYIFVTRNVARAFEDHLVAEQLRVNRSRFTEQQWNLAVDLTVKQYLCADNPAGCSDPDCDDFHDKTINPAVIADSALSVQERLRLLDEPTGPDGRYGRFSGFLPMVPKRGLFGDLVAEELRATVHALLYAADATDHGFVIVLHGLGRAYQGYWSPGGQGFVLREQYDRMAEDRVLSVADDRAYEWFCHQHYQNMPGTGWGENCKAFPSKDEWAAFITRAGLRNPAEVAREPRSENTAKPARKTPRTVSDRLNAVDVHDAAKYLYEKNRRKGIKANADQIVSGMRAAGAKGQDGALRRAYREYEAEHGDD